MATALALDFEKPIAELERQIEDLKKLATQRSLDVAREIAPLEAKLALTVTGPSTDSLGELLRKSLGQLKELFIVSEVSILDEAEASGLVDKAAGQETFSVNGQFGRLSAKPPVLMVGERAPGLKCQRCWVSFNDRPDSDLCPRCRDVVRV